MPQLRRSDGGWSYRIQLPPSPDGKRCGPLRRGGFATQDAAKGELGHVRDLLALADPREPPPAPRSPT
jgi:hypothetical protein